MPRLPDLVRDSRLDTEFHDGFIAHSYRTSDTASYKRSKLEKVLWQKERRIGSGGFGHVYLQKSTSSDGGNPQRRAVKRIRQATHRDYIHELEAIAKFSNPRYEHCFVKSYGWYEQGHSLCITMEYLSLGDLHHCISGQPLLLEQDVQTITSQILEGLQFMHDNEFAHRDIKPQNLLVRSKPPESWWVKIADFGISKRVDVSSNASTTIKGSLGFMAPETFHPTLEGEVVIARDPYAADIWSVGCVTYYLFTKSPPFRDNIVLLLDYYRGSTLCPVLSSPDSEISDTSQDFVSALLNANPKDRPTARNARMHKWLQHLIPEDLMSEMKIKHQKSSSTLDDGSSVFSEPDLPQDTNDDAKGKRAGRQSHVEASARWTTEYPAADGPLSPMKSSVENSEPTVLDPARVEVEMTEGSALNELNKSPSAISRKEDSSCPASECATTQDEGSTHMPMEDSTIDSSIPGANAIQNQESRHENSPKVESDVQVNLDQPVRTETAPPRKAPFKVLARWAWIGQNDGELSFPRGAVIDAEDVSSDWYFGSFSDLYGQRKSGIFPRSYVRPLPKDPLESSVLNQALHEHTPERGKVASKYEDGADHEYGKALEKILVDKKENSNEDDDGINRLDFTTHNDLRLSYPAPTAQSSAQHKGPIVNIGTEVGFASLSLSPHRKMSSPISRESRPEHFPWRHFNQSQTLVNESISESVHDDQVLRAGRSSAPPRNYPAATISRPENDDQAPIEPSGNFEPLSMEKLAIFNRSKKDGTYPSTSNIRTASSIQAVRAYGATKSYAPMPPWPNHFDNEDEGEEDDDDDDDDDDDANNTDSTDESTSSIKPSDSASGVGKSYNERDRTTYQETPNWLRSDEEAQRANKQSAPAAGFTERRDKKRVPEKDNSLSPREMIRQKNEMLKEKNSNVSPKEMLLRRKGISKS